MINIQEVKLKLYNRLKDSGWANVLKTFILSQDFDKILMKLIDITDSGRRFTPPLKTVFRAFEECTYEKLKVIILCPEPFNQYNVSDGIAFSCSNDNKSEFAIMFLKQIHDTVYKEQDYVYNKDLKRLSNQGVLLLNIHYTIS